MQLLVAPSVFAGLPAVRSQGLRRPVPIGTDNVRFRQAGSLTARQRILLDAVQGCLAQALSVYEAEADKRRGWSAWKRFLDPGPARPVANVAEITGYLRCSDPQGPNDAETIEKELFDLMVAGLVSAPEGGWSHRSYRVYAVSLTEAGKAALASK